MTVCLLDNFTELTKKGIIQKKEMSQIVRREIRGNETEIITGKICSSKTEKNSLLAEFLADFLKTFRERVSCFSCRCP